MDADQELEALRVPYVAGSALRGRARDERALVCNLSTRGVCVHVERLPGEVVEISLPMPDGGAAVRTRARVRWSSPADDPGRSYLPLACGLAFLDLAEADRARILRVAERYRDRPSPVVGITQPRSGILRVPLITGCTLFGGFGELRGKICNLSTFGVFATFASGLPPREEARLRLDLPEPLGRFEPRVSVAWCNPEGEERPHLLPAGCGLRFEGLARSEVRALIRVVDELLSLVPRGRG